MPARRCRHDESGQVIPLIAVFLLVLLLFCGMVIDMGNVYRVQQALQASTDAAAAAGAGQLTMSYPASSANAVSAAQSYDSAPGGKNPIPGIPSSSVTANIQSSCVATNPNLPCNNANTITVDQTAHVPTFFLHLLGWSSITLTTHASACSPCGEVPLDIQLVIDRTGSMADDSKMSNLKQGLLDGFLPGLDPTVDNVGLTLLPPDVNGTSDVCQAASSNNYNSNHATYTVVPLSNTYMDTSGNLVQSSPLISDINCLQPGGGTDYSNALEAGYAELQKDGRPGVQKIIVLLSDGAANTGQNCPAQNRNGTWPTSSDPHCTQPCNEAVNDAASYKSAGVLIYSILYGDQSGGPACQDWRGVNEVPFTEPWTAMQEIASPNDYYPDPDPTNLTTVFQQISSDMAAGTSRITD